MFDTGMVVVPTGCKVGFVENGKPMAHSRPSRVIRSALAVRLFLAAGALALSVSAAHAQVSPYLDWGNPNVQVNPEFLGPGYGGQAYGAGSTGGLLMPGPQAPRSTLHVGPGGRSTSTAAPRSLPRGRPTATVTSPSSTADPAPAPPPASPSVAAREQSAPQAPTAMTMPEPDAPSSPPEQPAAPSAPPPPTAPTAPMPSGGTAPEVAEAAPMAEMPAEEPTPPASSPAAPAPPPPPATRPEPEPAPPPAPSAATSPEPPAPAPSAPPAPPAAEEPQPQATASLPPASDNGLEDGSYQVVFAGDASQLPQDASEPLRGIAAELKGKQELRLQLMAYAGGEVLSSSKARRLSLSRALSVRSFLIENGVRSTRIDVRALGDKTTEEPVNRVDVIVTEQ